MTPGTMRELRDLYEKATSRGGLTDAEGDRLDELLKTPQLLAEWKLMERADQIIAKGPARELTPEIEARIMAAMASDQAPTAVKRAAPPSRYRLALRLAAGGGFAVWTGLMLLAGHQFNSPPAGIGGTDAICTPAVGLVTKAGSALGETVPLEEIQADYRAKFSISVPDARLSRDKVGPFTVMVDFPKASVCGAKDATGACTRWDPQDVILAYKCERPF